MIRERSGFYPGQSLDYLQALSMEERSPLISCDLHLDRKVDQERLGEAIQKTGETLPPVLRAYVPEDNGWEEVGWRGTDCIERDTGYLARWDLRRGPQVKIAAGPGEESHTLKIHMSHLLCDGQGFLQYLDLLCRCYNREELGNVKTLRRFAPAGRGMGQWPVPFSKDGLFFSQGEGQKDFRTVALSIQPGDLRCLKAWTSLAGVTMNDAFMAAYARVVMLLLGRNTFVLPCPVDLRGGEQEGCLTLGNMTGMYRCPITFSPEEPLEETCGRIHQEMMIQKGIYGSGDLAILDWGYRHLPRGIFGAAVKRANIIAPISYTNMGRIRQSFRFGTAKALRCFVTGSYREPPAFQLSVTTYRGLCTLSANLFGTAVQRKTGERIIRAVRAQLLELVCR